MNTNNTLIAGAWFVTYGLANSCLALVFAPWLAKVWAKSGESAGNGMFQKVYNAMLSEVHFIAKIDKFKIQRYLNYLNQLIQCLPRSSLQNAEHLFSQQIVSASLTAAASYLLLCVGLGMPLLLPLVLGLCIAFLQLIKISDQIKRHQRRCERELPYALDYLSLSLSAGLDFLGALETVSAEMPRDSALKHEFARILTSTRLGSSREEAILALAKRVPADGIRFFCQTITQAMTLGNDLVDTLQSLSDALRNQSSLQAEAEAGKISVRMMIPIMVFVIPATMIVIIGPMFLQWAKNTH